MRNRSALRALAPVLVSLACAGAGWAVEDDVPQTAIPWLSDIVRTPVTPAQRPLRPVAPEAPRRHDIAVSAAPGPDRDAVGLIPAALAGLPTEMWKGGDSARSIEMLRHLPPSPLPGIQDLVYRMVLSEAAPPDRDDDALLLARIDALLRRGAVDRAQALIERAGPETPALFTRWFDTALLTGNEDRACAALTASPDLSPSVAARVFCLARAGRWTTAALTLDTARALGDVGPDEGELLARFLDPDLAEMGGPTPVLRPVTPLTARLYEAIGEPLPTRDLPLAFAWTDLGFVSGWHAQLSAAERLARSGALSGNRLLGLYTERQAAASGAVWDRVRAVQALDLSLNAADHAATGPALLYARDVFAAAGLEPALAGMMAPRLERARLSGDAAEAATRLMRLDGTIPEDALSSADTEDRIADSIRAAFAGDEPPLTGGGTGEAILSALTLLSPGAEADPRDWAGALRLLRAAGQDDAARRIASDILLMGGTE